MNKKFYDYLFDFKNAIPPAKGRVLLAEPLLQGRYFARSVILLVEHNQKGSMGLVLNKPLSFNVNEKVDLFPSCESPLFLGGPVHTNHLFYIHTAGNLIPQSYPLSNDLFWGGDLKTVQNLLDNKIITSEQIRFFTGYAGWDKLQLVDEIDEKSWIVSLLSTETILQEAPQDLWKIAVSELGKKYRHWLNFPENPQHN